MKKIVSFILISITFLLLGCYSFEDLKKADQERAAKANELPAFYSPKDGIIEFTEGSNFYSQIVIQDANGIKTITAENLPEGVLFEMKETSPSVMSTDVTKQIPDLGKIQFNCQIAKNLSGKKVTLTIIDMQENKATLVLEFKPKK